MMLDEKRSVVAERLGYDIVLDEIAKALAAVGVGAAAPGLGTAEKSKSHRLLLTPNGARWIGAVRPSRRPPRPEEPPQAASRRGGLLRMRTFLNAIKGRPHAEERSTSASRCT